MFASRPGNGGFAKAMRINGEVLSILVGFHSEEEEEANRQRFSCENLLDL
jgi:hypothetical protein